MEGNNLTGKGTFILSELLVLLLINHCRFLLLPHLSLSLLHIVAAMKFNENLEELYLSRNHLAPEDGQHLGNILRSNHTLRVLDVSDNNLQVDYNIPH